MGQEDLWDAETARHYDTPGVGMFAPEVVGPTVERLTQLAKGGRALEFAIGTGRVAIPLAARGVPVTGIELSPHMVEQLRTKADGATIPVVVGDMASASAPRELHTGIPCVQHDIQSPESGRAGRMSPQCVLTYARRRFVIERWVPELRKLPPGQQATVWRCEDGYIGLDSYDTLRQQVVSHHFPFDESGTARLTRSAHRYVWPAELDLMAQLAGFELESRHADWAGAKFTAESRSTLRLPHPIAAVNNPAARARRDPQVKTEIGWIGSAIFLGCIT